MALKTQCNFIKRDFMKKWVIILAILITSPPLQAFKVFSNSALQSTSLAKIKDATELVICLEGGMSETDKTRSIEWITKASLAWLRVLKQMESNRSFGIKFSCQGHHLKVNMMRGNGRSYAGPGWTNIYLSSPYGTWTHELGHAFVGLSDTYVLSGGRAGVCQSGQPASLMCWGGYGPRANPQNFSTLWGDDIKGMTWVIFELFGPTTPSPYIEGLDLTAPFDVKAPWPISEFSDALANVSHEDDLIDTSGNFSDIKIVSDQEILCDTPAY